ncbi:MAG: hypothetical protein I3273_06550 [Candidatus Moeniiplasma glomeromycotorum]|nr:hypothetical protein [Candidatus Moeniiplasma glomeromycotorum]MCE8168478.1 hypothetical protein [Candidatus Moeniiplasma glomeromycotorum]MCE8169745.1 hypothetical protein [Candidatus Moeniiplasma glomeromycotorum]
MPNMLKDLQDRNRELLARIEELEKVNEPKEVTETEIEEIASSLEVPDEKVIEIVKSYFSYWFSIIIKR